MRDIFNWFIGGTSVLGIAKRLNEQGIPNPSAYKRQQGMNYRHPTSDKLDDLWPDSSVRRILRNPLYTGTMVQGKNRTKSYKLHVSEAVPEEDWITVEQTHEAIIPIELFDKAQALFERDTRTAPAQKQVYLFSGFLRCADCSKAMNRKLISQPHRDYYYYICSTFKKQHSGACTKHTIRSDRLEQAVLETLRSQIALAVEMDELIAEINRSGTRSRSADHLQAERAQLDSRARTHRADEAVPVSGLESRRHLPRGIPSAERAVRAAAGQAGHDALRPCNRASTRCRTAWTRPTRSCRSSSNTATCKR